MIELEIASIEDMAKIVAIEAIPENRSFIHADNLHEHEQMHNDSDILHLAILAEGKINGFVLLGGLDNQHRHIEFRRIVVKDKGKGIGRAAIEKVIDFCFDDLSCDMLWLDVFESNARARHIYRSLGFQEEKYQDDPAQDKKLIIMSICKK